MGNGKVLMDGAAEATGAGVAGGTMRAVVVRAPMQFGVESVPMPEAPEGGLLLDVKACGLCGSDLRTLRSGHRKVHLPYVIGHEICGVVAEIGPGYAGPGSAATC